MMILETLGLHSRVCKARKTIVGSAAVSQLVAPGHHHSMGTRGQVEVPWGGCLFFFYPF